VRTVNRTALVPFDADAMFALVSDVEAYPEFLPWCPATTVKSCGDQELEATLALGFGALNSKFTTRNQFVRPEWMSMRLMNGPFRSLDGRWSFEQLGDDGCEVTLHIEFEFANALNDKLFGAAFETICKELMDAFIKRAYALYD
jgi:ribosome-associated toxin RatA of RatAB toxin-antitoxin module